MSTGIEWADETWNPITGCTKVSDGCTNCYAERITNRFGGPGAFDTVVLHPERLDKPLHWRKPRRIFVNSMSDLFHDDVPDSFIGQVWATMSSAPQHQFQILTKRAGRMRSFVQSYVDALGEANGILSNVWLGTSVEDQKWADTRMPKLAETPAAVRFLSVEPLLGPVTFRWRPWAGYEPGWRERGDVQNHLDGLKSIGWVIVGGESGPGARRMDPAWVRTIRDECIEAGVPFLFKQWGGRTPKANGRELDGRTWDEFPMELVSA